MPAGVVVVKRARRRAFALLWAAPAWLRSIWSSRRWQEAPAMLHALASAPAARAEFPVLIREGGSGSPSYRCNACAACVPVCPSRCLHVAGEDAPTLFELDSAACIGCGECVVVCPETALSMHPAPSVLVTSRQGGTRPVDLLAPVGASK